VSDPTRTPMRIVVVGGGVGGMAAAWQVRKAAATRNTAVHLTVIEARPRVGGSVVTDRVDGCLVEGGPDCFVTDKPWGLQAIEELGLGDRLAVTNDQRRRTYVLWKGRPRPLPDGLILLVPTRIMPFITSTLFSWPGKLRMALDLVLPRRTDGADETLGDFIRRRLGSEALDKLGEPLVAGIHSGDPETMSIRATFPRFVDMEREQRSLIIAMLGRMRAAKAARAAAAAESAIAGGGDPRPPRTMFMTLDRGLGLLIDTLLERAAPDLVVTGDPAVAVERAGEEWVVRTVCGDVYPADGVLLATPAHASARLLEGVDPDLARELSEIPYVSSATVTLAYSAAEFPTRWDGFGLVIPKGEHRRVKAFTWVTSKFFDRAPRDIVLMRSFIRATAGETEGMSEDDMVAVAREELAGILGVAAVPLWGRAYRWDRAMPQYVVGHLDRIGRIETRLTALAGLRVAGGAYRGSGIPDTVRFSREQADALLDDLAGAVYPTDAAGQSSRSPEGVG
jgi:oxygen-dependent protoporphyrinogen oxidase